MNAYIFQWPIAQVQAKNMEEAKQKLKEALNKDYTIGIVEVLGEEERALKNFKASQKSKQVKAQVTNVSPTEDWKMISQQDRLETIAKNRPDYSITKKKIGNLAGILPVYSHELTYKSYYLGEWPTRKEAEDNLEWHLDPATNLF